MDNNRLQPRQSLNKAFLKVKPNRNEIEIFKKNLIQLLDQINERESEEFHKNLVADFLKNTYYSPDHFINTKGRNDLVIHNGKEAKSSVGVILEAKKPTNKVEMLKVDQLNTKAFQELILYFLREHITEKNIEIKYLVATNIYEWFIFDASIFEKFFAQNKGLVKQFTDFTAGVLTGTTTDFFYKQIAEPAIAAIAHEIPFTYFDFRDYESSLRNTEKEDDRKLIALFKLLSPEHLLKLPFSNDSNSLDKLFYSELLHIIGLAETKEGNKKLIQRKKEGDRNGGSLVENAINQLDSLGKINRLEKPEQFGENDDERLFNVGLTLAITWVNRILFLKLLEAQLIKYHKGDRSFGFLSLAKVKNYDDLNDLFFGVLARKPGERAEGVKTIFANVPYLNSSLFEPTEIEQVTIFMSNLRDESLPIFSATVLKDSQGKRRSGELNALEYLFEFLNAYDFSSEGSEDIQEENKRLINASVLGLIFEKINGYKDGSFFTPGFITMYMCRETIRRAVVQKFNEVKGWDCESLDQLYEKIKDKSEANQIINSLKICDPAVGSGHFLVSALNELIAIKSELKILQDRQGKTLRDYAVWVANDELVVTDEDGQLFEYNPKNKESQRVQETLFHEKQTIIEGCLFGVDINPNSVKICRLRLWIELLKNAYYKADNELETLPNIDINIKCGNSLISRFGLDVDVKQVLQKQKFSIEQYRNAVQTYRSAESKAQKREMEGLIAKIKAGFSSTLFAADPKKVKLRQLQAELYSVENQTLLLEETKAEVKAKEKRVNKLNNEIDKLSAEIEDIESGRIYENALEWRFEFPEVLNDDGDFVGFDVVITNPPYVVLSSFGDNEFKLLQQKFETAYGRINTFAIFTEFTSHILKRNSFCTLIIPDSLCNIDYYTTLRKHLLDNFNISEIVELGDGVFDEAVVPAIIFSFNTLNKSNTTSNSIRIKLGGKNTIFNNISTSILQDFYYKTPKLSFNLHIDEVFVKVQNSIDKSNAKLLKDIATIKIGICTGDNNKHISNKPIFPNSKKLLQGRNINKYITTYKDLFINYSKDELLRARDENIFLKSEKLLMRQTSDSLIVTLDTSQYYVIDSLFIIYSDKINIKYLLALLNSKLLNRQYQQLNPEKGRTFAQVKIDYVNELPIIVDIAYEKIVIEIVDKILSAKKGDRNADISKLENAIDDLVYQLYGLTEEEIKIVEGER